MTRAADRFAYRAVRADGVTLSASIDAPDRAAALRKLAHSNLTVISIETSRRVGTRKRHRKAFADRQLILKQLAVMLRAGVELLEAFETVRAGLPDGPSKDGMGQAVVRLRRGEKIASAMAAAMPEYPAYVPALIAAGEASGQLDRVLQEASEQFASEEKVRREIKSALIYPGFLVCAGLLVLVFLFYFVVPRFAAMIGPQRATLDGLPDMVLSVGETFRALGPLAFLSLLVPVSVARAAMSSHVGRHRIVGALGRIPGIRTVVATRQRARWTRVMGFAIGAGVGILDATRLAAEAVSEPRAKEALRDAIRQIRAGKPISEAMATPGLLAPIDISLLRVGQRAGALPQMFDTIADYHEANLIDLLKRTTAIVEQLAITVVASAIGVIVISLVSAMTSVYESIG